MCEFSTCWVTDRHFVRLCFFLKGPANLFSLLSPYSLGVKPGFYGSCSEWKHPLSGIFFFFFLLVQVQQRLNTELALLFFTDNPLIIMYPMKKKKKNIVIALSYIYAESWQVSSAYFLKAFSQCSTVLVCLGKCAFNIHHQRLQAVNVQLEALTLCPAAPLDFTKAHFFSAAFCPPGRLLFSPQNNAGFSFWNSRPPRVPSAESD